VDPVPRFRIDRSCRSCSDLLVIFCVLVFCFVKTMGGPFFVILRPCGCLPRWVPLTGTRRLGKKKLLIDRFFFFGRKPLFFPEECMCPLAHFLFLARSSLQSPSPRLPLFFFWWKQSKRVCPPSKRSPGQRCLYALLQFGLTSPGCFSGLFPHCP